MIRFILQRNSRLCLRLKRAIEYARREGVEIEIDGVDGPEVRDPIVDFDRATVYEREVLIACAMDPDPVGSMRRNLPPPILYLVQCQDGTTEDVRARIASEAMAQVDGATSALPRWLEIEYLDRQTRRLA